MIALRNTLIQKYLARHELVNSRICFFKILHNKYAIDLSFYPKIFQAICNIVQLQIEIGELLTDISV